MSSLRTGTNLDGVPTVHLESRFLEVEVAPSVGGRIVSLIHNATGSELLWRNHALRLQRLSAGSEYDPNFYGGIDELLPNDMPETIDGVPCPDHGELWTTGLDWHEIDSGIKLSGTLPGFGLGYERTMALGAERPRLDFNYRITNLTDQPRHFLWKLHAALAVEAGDLIECPARKAQVVDLAWSRQKSAEPFPWPELQGNQVNVVPAPDGTMDFFYLFDLSEGRLALHRPRSGLRLEYHFDARVFPYAWVFASYGGFLSHYTVILEPCTAMPMSVNEAAKLGQCTVLAPGETLTTEVSIRVGPSKL